MPDRRPCACDKCGRRFDFVHHLHRHAVLQHGLGFRVDPDTDCVQAYRPADLLDMQKRFRGWQGHQHDHDQGAVHPDSLLTSLLDDAVVLHLVVEEAEARDLGGLRDLALHVWRRSIKDVPTFIAAAGHHLSSGTWVQPWTQE